MRVGAVERRDRGRARRRCTGRPAAQQRIDQLRADRRQHDRHAAGLLHRLGVGHARPPARGAAGSACSVWSTSWGKRTSDVEIPMSGAVTAHASTQVSLAAAVLRASSRPARRRRAPPASARRAAPPRARRPGTTNARRSTWRGSSAVVDDGRVAREADHLLGDIPARGRCAASRGRSRDRRRRRGARSRIPWPPWPSRGLMTSSSSAPSTSSSASGSARS